MTVWIVWQDPDRFDDYSPKHMVSIHSTEEKAVAKVKQLAEVPYTGTYEYEARIID